MTRAELLKRFDAWWEDEGNLMVPLNNNADMIKKIALIAWLNGAHISTEGK